MKHYIIVQWNESVIESQEFYKNIEELFNLSLHISGIHRIDYSYSCINLPNRFDFMVCINMDKAALARFDDSSIHRQWKTTYNQLIKTKTIFDCE